METKAKTNFDSHKYKVSVRGAHINIYVSDVSPVNAAYILRTRNKKNRGININHVNALKKNMLDGTWRFNGDTICFDSNGVLIDGQHRLSAIEKSGVTVPCIIVEGLTADAIKTKDMEIKKRNLGDLLQMDGIANSKMAASFVIRYFGLICGRTIIKTTGQSGNSIEKDLRQLYTLDQKYDFYYSHQELIDEAVNYVRSLYKKNRILTPSDVGGIFIYLYVNRQHSENEIKKFFDGLYVSSEMNVINFLRNKLISDLTSTKKMPGTNKQSLIAKAWNYYIKGKDVKVLSYVPTSEGKIDFI